MTTNTILHSEQFERAAYSLQHAIERHRIDAFEEAVQLFGRSVDRLCEAIERLERVIPKGPTP